MTAVLMGGVFLSIVHRTPSKLRLKQEVWCPSLAQTGFVMNIPNQELQKKCFCLDQKIMKNVVEGPITLRNYILIKQRSEGKIK